MIRLTAEEIAAMELALNRGERLELAVMKDGVKIWRSRRECLKIETNKDAKPHP